MQISKKNLKTLTILPGCYIFRDDNEKVLYVGKANNLRVRVNQYFAKNGDERAKIEGMIDQAKSVEVITVDSEAEALILEANLIKKYRPKYNSMLKDDKSYVWVMFEKGVDFPRPKIVRKKKIKNAEYFGPYPRSFPAKQVLHELRQLFPYCVSNFKTEKVVKDIGVKRTAVVKGVEKRPCLDYYTGFCSGVCAGLVSRTEHKRNISHIKKFFRGEKREMYDELERQMKIASKEKDFEKAAEIRDKLQNLVYVTQGIKIKSSTDEGSVKKAAKSYLKEAEVELLAKTKLRKVKNTGEIEVKDKYRIECYDISNIQGKQATGSMVVFVDGKAEKSQYRKFKIRSKDTPDDFFMMQETLTRRFNRAEKGDEKFLPLPDLVIIDGGKGQLSSAYEILKKFDFDRKIAILGLAKREEELFRIHQVGSAGEIVETTFSKTTLPRRSKALYLVQRIRDEAHRFAIGYHRKLREKNSIRSSLSEVPGVGALTEKKLIKAFGSLDKVKKAKIEDLRTVVRNRKTAEAIKKLL